MIVTVRRIAPHTDEELAAAHYIEVYRRAWETQTLPETVARLGRVRGVPDTLLQAALAVMTDPQAVSAPRDAPMDLLNVLTNLQMGLRQRDLDPDAIPLVTALHWIAAFVLRPALLRPEEDPDMMDAIVSWVGVHDHGWAFHAAGITAAEYQAARPSLSDALAIAALRHPRPLPPIPTA